MEPLSIITGTTKTLSALASLYHGCIAINSRFLAKKIEKFSEKPFEEDVVRNFVRGIDINQWEKIQDGIIHQLTQAESIVKAIYERNLVEALLTHNISDPEFWRMNFILQHLYSLDIEDLIHLYNGGACTEEQKKNFAFYQLLKENGEQTIDGEAFVLETKYYFSNLGRKFVNAIKGE